MRKLLIISLLVVFIVGCIVFSTSNKTNTEFLRIHIRANSNLDIDQNVKYKVKDAVVEALIPFVSKCDTKEKAEIEIKNNFALINRVANEVLEDNGFYYQAKAKLVSEEFPTRAYDGFVLEEGIYDALILELGEGEGDNWWCVVYPPLCFVEVNPYGNNIVYKSKILEIIKKVCNKE